MPEGCRRDAGGVVRRGAGPGDGREARSFSAHSWSMVCCARVFWESPMSRSERSASGSIITLEERPTPLRMLDR